MGSLIIRLQTTVYRFAPLMQQKKNLFIVAALFWILLISIPMLVDVFGQGPPCADPPCVPPGRQPKVDIEAERHGNVILVTWNNPLSTPNGIPFRYTILKEVNLDSNEFQIFDTLRNIQEKTVNRDGEETYFHLDEDITGGNNYTYRIQAGAGQGQGNGRFSDVSQTIFIDPQVQFVRSESNGHLIVGRTLTPIIQVISWFDLFPIQEASAEDNVNSIFTTSLNPQTESFRLALEPVPRPDSQGNCDQVLEFGYSRNIKQGQDFEIVASIFETEIQTDDDTGTEVSVKVKILRHQKTFQDFSDTTKLKQKWLTIPPEEQKIVNFTSIEVQYDITGEFEGDPFEHRSLAFHETLFLVPLGNNAC